MTPQSPPCSPRTSRPAAGDDGTPGGAPPPLPWWALALPALAFAALLALLSGAGGHVSAAAQPGPDLPGCIAAALPQFVRHLLP